MTYKKNRKAFTLLEIIIVIGIFSVVSIISVDAYLNGFRSEQRANLQNKVMQDARLILNTLAAEINNSRIDYEEYFNQCVILGNCPDEDLEVDSISEDDLYGQNHGYYSWQFYHGGFLDASMTTPDGHGTICQLIDSSTVRYPDEDCVTGPLSYSDDSNTGVNPSTPDLTNLSGSTNATAFCAKNNFKLFDTNATNGIMSSPSKNNCIGDIRVLSELYLISSDSNRKVIIGKGFIGDGNTAAPNYAVKKLELELVDIDTDTETSLPIQIYQCTAGYACTGETNEVVTTTDPVDVLGNPVLMAPRNALYELGDSENIYTNFVPISPLSVNVKNLEFIVTPHEDPYKAYREEGLIHPKVTIHLEVEPSTRFRLPFFSSRFNLKLQTTVSTAL